MKTIRCVLGLFMSGVCAAALAQYPGHVNKDANAAPTLRATGIFEWTGDLDKPKAGRLIPLTVWDGQQYQPGGLYLAQPAPLTVLTGTVYELEQAGTPKGLFSVNGAENLQGSWIAIGSVKPEMAKAKARPPMSKHPPQVIRDAGSTASTADSDRPTLQRKDTSDSSSSSGSSQTGSGSAASSNPDQPTLHRRDASETGSGSGSSGNSTSSQSAPSSDSDRPTLHRPDSDDNAQNTPAVDPDRPRLHEAQNTPGAYSGAPVTATANTDPNRPMLRYGKPETPEGIVLPSKLEGLPVDMNQMAAISDVKTGEPHPFTYSWADPEDAAKMKTAMEVLAQKAIAEGFNITPPAKIARTTAKTSATRRKAAPPSPLPQLEDEKFNVFELSYNGGATVVLTAKSMGDNGEAKYVALVAQPDFYGTPHVLFKQLTTDKGLDISPRMRLVDAADTDGDGRAELIFELRGKTGRSFAIYRVEGGRVLEAYNTGPLP